MSVFRQPLSAGEHTRSFPSDDVAAQRRESDFVNILCWESADHFTGIWVGYLNTEAGAGKVSILFNPDVRTIHEKSMRCRGNHRQDILFVACPGKVLSIRTVGAESVVGLWSVKRIGGVSSRNIYTTGPGLWASGLRSRTCQTQVEANIAGTLPPRRWFFACELSSSISDVSPDSIPISSTGRVRFL